VEKVEPDIIKEVLIDDADLLSCDLFSEFEDIGVKQVSYPEIKSTLQKLVGQEGLLNDRLQQKFKEEDGTMVVKVKLALTVQSETLTEFGDNGYGGLSCSSYESAHIKSIDLMGCPNLKAREYEPDEHFFDKDHAPIIMTCHGTFPPAGEAPLAAEDGNVSTPQKKIAEAQALDAEINAE